MFLKRLKKIQKFYVFLFLFSASANAASTTSFDKGGFHITVEPILAYEFTSVNTPEVHTRGMLQYGARVTAGQKLVSGEAEYTQGTVNETFPLEGENTKTTKQNLLLGIRSAITANAWLDFTGRLGGEATKIKVDTTTVSTASTLTSSPDWDIHPYAGLGLEVHLLSSVAMGLEATYLFRSVKDWSQNDVQASFSIKINLPTK